MKIVHVVGARPNFMKVSPVMAAIERLAFAEQVLVHTGQHYDASMSQVFFKQLGLQRPDFNLDVGSGSHAEQTAHVMLRFEKVSLDLRPDLVLVYGDVNSTIAAALVCAKLHIPVGHVEAGLRSGDWRMPEEVNRVVTDRVADLLFTPSADADANLLAEGVLPQKIFLVGNVMIDTLTRLLPQAEQSGILKQLGLLNGDQEPQPYALATLHRPSNVDDSENLTRLLHTLQEIGSQVPIIFPLHPRTAARIEELQITVDTQKVRFTEPLAYLEFLCLQKYARLVITDSGGIQEETTFLGVTCLTMRDTTERPITTQIGTNQLLGDDMDQLLLFAKQILGGQSKKGEIPPLWDGYASHRIAEVIQQWRQSRVCII
jgi:UDP-N-acetylglucosamine 2-epimerase (non-hydrolysing)